MDNVLTLVSATTTKLEDAAIDRVSTALSRHGADISRRVWLAQDKACDLYFGGLSPVESEQVARPLHDGKAVDMLAQAQAGRRKKLFVADMDSTIVKGETLDDLAELAGVGPLIAEITARAMNGELDFRQALQERMAMLRGLPVSLLEQSAASLRLNPGARCLIQTLKANRVYTALVSGGFRYFTERVARDLGFDFNTGNRLDIENGKLTGRIVDPIVTKSTKLELLQDLAAERGVALADCLTVGDGANDLPMLQAAGLGVAYHAKPVVVAGARARITHTDLATLLYYQGYSESEFVT